MKTIIEKTARVQHLLNKERWQIIGVTIQRKRNPLTED